MDMKAEQNLYVAFDLGTSCLRGAIGQRNDDGTVSLLTHESERSVNAIKRGAVKNFDNVANSIKRIKQKLENGFTNILNEGATEEDEYRKFVIKRAYIGLNGFRIWTVETTVKRSLSSEGVVITNEIMSALHREAIDSKVADSEVLEAVPYRYIVDDEEESACPIGVKASHIVVKYNLIVGSPSLKSDIQQCFNSAGIEVAGFIISPIASANVVVGPDGRELGTIVLNFGQGVTSLAIYKDCKIAHASVIPFGGNNITEDIRQELMLTADAAESLKRYGSAMPSLVDDVRFSFLCNGSKKEIEAIFLSEIIGARIGEVMSYVADVLRQNPDFNTMDKVLITGGGAKLQNLRERVESELGFECDYGVLKYNVSEDTINMCAKEFSFTQIIGLLSMCEKNCIEVSVPSNEPATEEKPNRNTKHKKETVIDGISSLFGKIVNSFGASD